MNMDNHSKNVCLIGVLHILGYIIFSLDPVTRGIRFLNSNDNDNVTLGSETIFLLAVAGFFLLLAILEGVMIRGVIKQRHLLVAPFLVIFSLLLATTIILLLIHLIIEIHATLYYIKDFLYIIGVQIMSIYPIYTLYSKLRLRSLKEKSLAENEKERMAC
ncbi:uncharacterized protein LOC135962394 [Calliphora vicina]|uniref:uncharacterized protein LOC135962394 n=1 Tax=Calliphora vicina TaxID=7373 RepID=UPI00325BB804